MFHSITLRKLYLILVGGILTSLSHISLDQIFWLSFKHLRHVFKTIVLHVERKKKRSIWKSILFIIWKPGNFTHYPMLDLKLTKVWYLLSKATWKKLNMNSNFMSLHLVIKEVGGQPRCTSALCANVFLTQFPYLQDGHNDTYCRRVLYRLNYLMYVNNNNDHS
jgi:hypothetical protein